MTGRSKTQTQPRRIERIGQQLDDVVKVNYGEFGDLLAEVKAVCGKDKE